MVIWGGWWWYNGGTMVVQVQKYGSGRRRRFSWGWSQGSSFWRQWAESPIPFLSSLLRLSSKRLAGLLQRSVSRESFPVLNRVVLLVALWASRRLDRFSLSSWTGGEGDWAWSSDVREWECVSCSCWKWRNSCHMRQQCRGMVSHQCVISCVASVHSSDSNACRNPQRSKQRASLQCGFWCESEGVRVSRRIFRNRGIDTHEVSFLDGVLCSGQPNYALKWTLWSIRSLHTWRIWMCLRNKRRSNEVPWSSQRRCG